MGTVVETLCGQAYGAGRMDMLGVYLQRSWITLLATCLILCFIYIYAGKLLKLLGELDEISKATVEFALLMLPQLFAYALNHPISKFLQSQREDDGDVLYFGLALLHTVFSLGADAECGLGSSGCSGGAEFDLVVHCCGSAVVYSQRKLWPCMVWSLMEGLPDSLGISQVIHCIRCNAQV